MTSADAITYLALVNPSGTATTATVTYRHANGATYPTTVAVPAERRVTLATPSWVPAGSYGITVTTSPMGVVAERMVLRRAELGVGARGGGSFDAAVPASLRTQATTGLALSIAKRVPLSKGGLRKGRPAGSTRTSW